MTSKRLQNEQYTKTNGPHKGKAPGAQSGVQLGPYTGPEKLNRQKTPKNNGGKEADPNKGKGRHTTI